MLTDHFYPLSKPVSPIILLPSKPVIHPNHRPRPVQPTPPRHSERGAKSRRSAEPIANIGIASLSIRSTAALALSPERPPHPKHHPCPVLPTPPRHSERGAKSRRSAEPIANTRDRILVHPNPRTASVRERPPFCSCPQPSFPESLFVRRCKDTPYNSFHQIILRESCVK
jgi:hypothetical protein